MMCQILFLGKNKKNIINLPTAEFDKRVVKVSEACYSILCQKSITLIEPITTAADNILKYILFFFF